jgi:hypothetical protein
MLFAKAVVLTDVTSKANHLGERQKIYDGHGGSTNTRQDRDTDATNK